MGSQQLLLLILGTLTVGLMLTFAIVMFGDSAAASNRDAVASELTSYASKAQLYYRKPRVLGGGGGTFNGFSLGGSSVSDYNGTFSVSSTSPAMVTIEGIGIELGYDHTNPVKVAIDVQADSIFVNELN
jgi:hypothetical protein